MVKKTPLSPSEIIALEGLILLTQGTPLPLIYHLQNPNTNQVIEYESREITALEGILRMKKEIKKTKERMKGTHKIRIPLESFKIRIPLKSFKIRIPLKSFKIRISRPEEEIKFNSINNQTVIKRKLKKQSSKMLYCDIAECLKSYKSENGLKYHKRTKHN